MPFSSSSASATAGGITNPVGENLDLQDNDILNCGTLNYTALNPPISSGSAAGSSGAVQTSNGSGGFTDSGSTAAHLDMLSDTTTDFVINSTDLVVDKSAKAVGIGKVPTNTYPLQISGAGNSNNAFQIETGDGKTFQFNSSGLALYGSDFLVNGSLSMLGAGKFIEAQEIRAVGALRTDQTNNNCIIGTNARTAHPQSGLEVLLY